MAKDYPRKEGFQRLLMMTRGSLIWESSWRTAADLDSVDNDERGLLLNASFNDLLLISRISRTQGDHIITDYGGETRTKMERPKDFFWKQEILHGRPIGGSQC